MRSAWESAWEDEHGAPTSRTHGRWSSSLKEVRRFFAGLPLHGPWWWLSLEAEAWPGGGGIRSPPPPPSQQRL